MDNGPEKLTSKHFFVVPYFTSGREPKWKLEIRASFAGKKIRRFFDTEADAFAEGHRLTGQIRDGGVHSLETQGDSVARAINRFWAARGAKITGAHRQGVQGVLSRFEKDFGRRGVRSIGARELSAFWDRPEWPDGRASRWRAFSVLRMFFNWCERWDIVNRNPTRKCDPPTRPSPLTGIVSPEQMQDLVSLKNDYLRAWVCLGGFAGLRASEALVLRPEDIDWPGKEIHVVGGKTGERYVTMLPAFARHCPREWKMPNRRNLYMALKKAIREELQWGQGFPQNALRHSFATYLLAKCKNASRVAHEMGHKGNPEMVNRVYALRARKADQRKYWAI